jgi:hypothetical protein
MAEGKHILRHGPDCKCAKCAEEARIAAEEAAKEGK